MFKFWYLRSLRSLLRPYVISPLLGFMLLFLFFYLIGIVFVHLFRYLF